jgi:hypothetical protein
MLRSVSGNFASAFVFSDKLLANPTENDDSDLVEKIPNISWMTRISKGLSHRKQEKLSDSFFTELRFLKESQQEFLKISDQKWPFRLPAGISFFLQQYEELEKLIAENPSNKTHGKACENLKKQAEVLLIEIAELKRESIRSTIRFSLRAFICVD